MASCSRPVWSKQFHDRTNKKTPTKIIIIKIFKKQLSSEGGPVISATSKVKVER